MPEESCSVPEFTIVLERADEECSRILETLKSQLMRKVGAIKDFVQIVIDCSKVKKFSTGVVKILHAMRAVARLNGWDLFCQNLTNEARLSLIEKPGGAHIPVVSSA